MTEILLIVTLNTINQNQLVVAIEYELYKLIKYFEIRIIHIAAITFLMSWGGAGYDLSSTNSFFGG
jgi:hypothetical protein